MNKQIVTKVTVTGADDSVRHVDLVKIQRLYPYAEFGILMSERYSTGSGAGRFPSKAWLIDLVKCATHNKLNLSGHICGQWVKDAYAGEWPDLGAVDADLRQIFQRFQLNTHAQKHQLYADDMSVLLADLEARNQTVIFQLDGGDGTAAAREMVTTHKNVAGLFDLSHGAGILPDEWPSPIPGLATGYAGGLSPGNVVEQMDAILVAADGQDIWIDAETHLWSPDDRTFDLEKVVAFLEKAAPYVKG